MMTKFSQGLWASPHAGAVITNLARFGDWERWNYDWDLDVEPTLREIARAPSASLARLPDQISVQRDLSFEADLRRRASLPRWHRPPARLRHCR